MESNETDVRDLKLLHRFTSGDRQALGALAAEYERSMLGLARGWLNNDAERARDAVQETWLRVIRSAADFKGNSSVKTWLYRILHNCCHDIRRRQAKQDKQNESLNDGRAYATVREGTDDNEKLRSAVSSLAEPLREALLLCYHAGMTQQQAAEILELPAGTLKSRVRAAMTELRDVLKMDEQP